MQERGGDVGKSKFQEAGKRGEKRGAEEEVRGG